MHQLDKLSGLFKKQNMKLEGEHVRGNMGKMRAYIFHDIHYEILKNKENYN